MLLFFFFFFFFPIDLQLVTASFINVATFPQRLKNFHTLQPPSFGQPIVPINYVSYRLLDFYSDQRGLLSGPDDPMLTGDPEHRILQLIAKVATGYAHRLG